MIPSQAERDALFAAFSKALFERDMEALYRAVTPDFLWSYHDGLTVTKSLTGAAAISEHLADSRSLFSAQKFHQVVFHHLPDVTFMTMRVSETVRSDWGALREQRGIESYTFKDGKIATKDVYRKPIAV